MAREVVDAVLAGKRPGDYVDASFGRGGYAEELLRRMPSGSRLVVFADEGTDPAGFQAARELQRSDPRVEAVISRPASEILEALAGRELAGVVVDLGVAFQQGEDAFRGFTPVDDVPLDLRVDPSRGVPAAEWLRSTTAEELAWVVHAYGEDDDPLVALRIAEAVMDRQRRHGTYSSVYQLVEVIRKVKTAHEDRGLHPAKLTVQALRTFVNGEFEQLEDVLEGACRLLTPGGRLAVVTTRRAEAALVKSFMRTHENSHGMFEACSSPQRLLELYPLLQKESPFAVQQACEPLWPPADGGGGRKGGRSLAAHVIQRTARVRAAPAGAAGLQPRSEEQLFARPKQMEFLGGAAP